MMITVQAEKSLANATMSPSSDGDPERDLQPARVEPAAVRLLRGRLGGCLAHGAQPTTLARTIQTRPVGAEAAPRLAPRRARREEPVDGRAGAADVGAEGAELAQLVGERRRREVVRRQRGEIARRASAASSGRAGAPRSRPRRPARRTPRRRRRSTPSRAPSGRTQEHGVVLRQVERRQSRAVALAELRALGEEERDVGAERGGELVQLRSAGAAGRASRSRAAARRRRPSCRRRARRRPGSACRCGRASAARRRPPRRAARARRRTSVSSAKPVDARGCAAGSSAIAVGEARPAGARS